MSFFRRHMEWFVCAAVGLALAAAVIVYERGAYEAPSLLRMLCDGTFVAGIFLCCFGALALVSGGGAFDAMGFAVHTLVRKFSPRKDRFESRQTYWEYKAARREKKSPDVKCVLVTGAGYLMLASVLLVAYYR